MSLTDEQISYFQKRLEAMKLELTKVIEGSKKEVSTPDESKGYSQHSADEGTDDFVRSVHLRVTDKEFAMLRQIDRALEKIQERTYGICDISGEVIPLKRLEALPYATTTVKAQEKMEKGLI
jgi:DnaK suppressor protein